MCVSVCVLYINIRKEKRGERKTDERGVHPARDEERGLRAASQSIKNEFRPVDMNFFSLLLLLPRVAQTPIGEEKKMI